MSLSVLFRGSIVLSTVALFAGCGGGGDSTPDETPPPSGPDPYYSSQWHLKNTGQAGGGVGEDINVEPAWASVKGSSVKIAVVDDGMDIYHEDLVSNVVPGSYNYINGGSDPSANSKHGTQVAGLAGARDLNGTGVRGVAPRASLVSYNLLRNWSTSNAADAATRGLVHVNTNSWGPADDGDLHDPGTLWRDAIEYGLTQGRGGLGTVYTWAAGNGGTGPWPYIDNSNYDGQANHRGVIAVAAVTDKGFKASYSERGANLWVSAPAGEYCSSGQTLTTTDMTGLAGSNSGFGTTDYSNNNYTKCMNGTSGATPIVAGTVALMLEANPKLTWRDVRLILAETARKNDPFGSWTLNGAGYDVSYDYGFGVVDAGAAVARAKAWANVGPLLGPCVASSSPAQPIPDLITGTPSIPVVDTINMAGCAITKIEWVEVTFNTDHTYSGDLDVMIEAPSGTLSRLAEPHDCGACSPYSNWVFGSARHLGEGVNGTWTLTVADGIPGDTGTLQSWGLKFYGR